MGRKKEDSKKKKPMTTYLKKRPRRPCYFCEKKITYIDYKDLELLSRFVSERYKVLPIKQSCCCAAHQRELAQAIKRARHIGLLPITTK